MMVADIIDSMMLSDIISSMLNTNDQERMMLSDIIDSMFHQRSRTYDVERYYKQYVSPTIKNV